MVNKPPRPFAKADTISGCCCCLLLLGSRWSKWRSGSEIVPQSRPRCWHCRKIQPAQPIHVQSVQLRDACVWLPCLPLHGGLGHHQRQGPGARGGGPHSRHAGDIEWEREGLGVGNVGMEGGSLTGATA